MHQVRVCTPQYPVANAPSCWLSIPRITLSVTKVPLEVPHDCGTALIITGMSFEAPFSKKRRSPLEPESSRTLIAIVLAISLVLIPLSSLIARLGRVLAFFSFKLVFSRSYLLEFRLLLFSRNLKSFENRSFAFSRHVS